MRTLVLSALLAGSLAAGGAAFGTPEPLPTGTGCTYNAVGGGALGEPWRAVVYSEPVAAAAVDDAAGNPVSITVVCTLHVAGTAPDPAIEVSGSGTGVAAVAPTAVTFTMDEFDHAYVCTEARLTDARGATRTYYLSDNNGMWHTSPACDGLQCLAFGANCVYALAMVEWLLNSTSLPDSALCPQLVALAPGVPGVVDIRADGDVYVAGEWVWDCPPYGNG